MNSYKITGIVLIVISGFIYTLEKGFSLLASSIVKAGFFSGAMGGLVPEVESAGFFDNLYVPIFMVVGFGLIIYGFRKK